MSKISPAIMKRLHDPRQFFKFLKVFDKDSGKLVPFVLNAEQEELLDALLTHQKVVVCKARQIGCSTLIRAYFLWKTYVETQPTRSAIISYTRDSADHLHSIDKEFYLSMPKPLQRKLSKSSSRTLQFGDTKAELRAFTGGGKGGATRSFTFSSAHISEFAFFDDQSDLLANIQASVGEGQLIIETTPNGPGDVYHRLCNNAKTNGWHLCFFPWFKHNRYKKKSQFGSSNVPNATEDELSVKEELELSMAQLYWRRTQISTMGLEKFQREFPSSVDEAFMTSSNVFFPTDIVDNLDLLELGKGPEMYYCDVMGDKYAMGVDVAHGNGGDYSTVTIVSCTTMQPVYHYRSNRIRPEDFAEKIWDIYWEYDEPYTIVEANGPGALVLYRLKEFRMKNLYKNKHNKDWNTRKENKMAIYDHFRELICDGTIDCLEATLWGEMRNTICNEGGAPSHPKGQNDDLIISTALALWGAKLKPAPSLYEVKRELVDKFIAKTKARRTKAKGPIPYRIKGKKYGIRN